MPPRRKLPDGKTLMTSMTLPKPHSTKRKASTIEGFHDNNEAARTIDSFDNAQYTSHVFVNDEFAASQTNDASNTAAAAASTCAHTNTDMCNHHNTTTATTIKNNNTTTTANTNSNTNRCLHCHTNASTTTNIQVRCDECSSYICGDCHWCHEYQANHEIRVCDRCDIFVCRHCDEMDQCEYCGEVVCKLCATLLRCKFCGGSLCEDCATACGRCGIVLCSRDAKFAVDCDTCKLSYCLVCLASGSKDPCVRCGHRPSKRMEQLVHLRLKSIYKAFKQSSSGLKVAAAAAGRRKDGFSNGSNNDNDNYIPDDPELLFQAAASAAAKSSAAAARLGRGTHRSSQTSSPNQETNASTAPVPETYMAKMEKADAAAAELLAELEEEEAAKKKKSKKKKDKKKKLPEQQQEDLELDGKGAKPAKLDDAINGTKNGADDFKRAAQSSSPVRLPTSPKRSGNFVKVVAEEVKPAPDPMEQLLCELVTESNIDGIEAFLASLKGVPGKAVLRKNTKKALKKLRSVDDEPEMVEQETDNDVDTRPGARTPVEPTINRHSDLLKIVSHSHCKIPTLPSSQRRTQAATVARSECVMHMSPNIVGYVIGRGGQRIRDLMEESGARVWIDQDSMSPSDHRIVYISGSRKCVDAAMKMMMDLAGKAPLGTPGSKQMAPSIDGGTAKSPLISSSKSPAFLDVAELSASVAGLGVQQRSHLAADTKASPLSSERTSQVISCDPRFVPLLIGRRGWTIKNIQDSSGAKVDIDQTVIPRKITVSGSVTQVSLAVKMVHEVLDYPQSQLQSFSGFEPLEDCLANQRNHAIPPVVSDSMPASPSPEASKHVPAHSSPPSSLIMPNDAASASSSLSSTPEPSMASLSTRGQMYQHLPAGPMLPLPCMGVNLTAQHSLLTSDLGPDALQQARLPSDLLTPVRPNHEGETHDTTRQAITNPIGAVGTNAFSSRQISGTYASTVIGERNFGHAMNPAINHQTQTARSHTAFELPSVTQRGFVDPVPPLAYNGLTRDDPILPPPGESWSLNHSAPRSPSHPLTGRTSSDGFYLDAAVDFLQNSSSTNAHRDTTLPGIALPPSRAGLHERTASAPTAYATTGGMADESLIVDSLFGPLDNGGNGGGSALLAGLQGLSLSKEPPADGGIWGSAAVASHIGGFETVEKGHVPAAELFDMHHQHPSQSRFGW
ncbi:hypothetical protein MPSEU_000170400 [Mayamaea pseudoterrestris]|nr:hypothetical protein MPSEU_000170400 [Mayamaea pseudoterrestris]